MATPITTIYVALLFSAQTSRGPLRPWTLAFLSQRFMYHILGSYSRNTEASGAKKEKVLNRKGHISTNRQQVESAALCAAKQPDRQAGAVIKGSNWTQFQTSLPICSSRFPLMLSFDQHARHRAQRNPPRVPQNRRRHKASPSAAVPTL